ncbi:MAG: NUDIX domain-containing protein [Patescibacteria group bacterium]
MQEPIHSSTRRSISSRRGKLRGGRKVRTEVSAGGLVFRRTKRGVQIAMLEDAFGHWTFPKGHVRRLETLRDAAEREIAEELSLTGLQFRGQLGTIDIWFRDRFVWKGMMIHKFIHYFLFEAPADQKLVPPPLGEHGEQILAVAWVPVEKVLRRSTYRDLQPIIEKAIGILRLAQPR